MNNNTGIQGGGLIGGAQAIRQPLIQCEMSDLQMSVEELGCEISKLLSRIDGLLTPPTPQTAKDKEQIQPVLPQHGEQIRAVRCNLRNMAASVRDANCRIEI